MTVERLERNGVLLALIKRTEAHPDLRGAVTETYRESWFSEVPPVRQLVQSVSVPKTLRGMHLHKRQWDIWRFTEGSARIRLFDHATGATDIISSDGAVIAIPPGISHGFYAPFGCTLVYALTEEYDGTDEYGWFPFDGEIDSGLHWMWPLSHENIVISLRDLRAPRLAEFAG